MQGNPVAISVALLAGIVGVHEVLPYWFRSVDQQERAPIYASAHESLPPEDHTHRDYSPFAGLRLPGTVAQTTAPAPLGPMFVLSYHSKRS